MVAEVKLNQRNLENNDLQENLNRALMSRRGFSTHKWFIIVNACFV